MRPLLISWVSLCMSVGGWAQVPRLDVGLDITKMLPVFQDRGLMVEPFVHGYLKNNFRWRAAVGYANVEIDTIYRNLNYRNSGWYVKAGVGKQLAPIFQISTSLIYTSFTETGTSRLIGSTFGDLIFRASQESRLLGAELALDVRADLSTRWSLNTQGRISTLLTKPASREFDTFFAPGVGQLQRGNPANNVRKDVVLATGGISVQIVYRLGQPESINKN